MPGHMKMQNTATIVSQHKEAIENAEGESRDGKEIHGGNRFPVIAQERFPESTGIGLLRRAPHPA